MNRIIEAMHSWLKQLGEDSATNVQISYEASEAVQSLAQSLAQLAETQRALVGKVGELADSVAELNRRFGMYLNDQAKQQSSVREVDRRLRVVEGKVSDRG